MLKKSYTKIQVFKLQVFTSSFFFVLVFYKVWCLMHISYLFQNNISCFYYVSHNLYITNHFSNHYKIFKNEFNFKIYLKTVFRSSRSTSRSTEPHCQFVHAMHVYRATDWSIGKPSGQLGGRRTDACFVSVEIDQPGNRPKSMDSSKFERSVVRPVNPSFVRNTITASF